MFFLSINAKVSLGMVTERPEFRLERVLAPRRERSSRHGEPDREQTRPPIVQLIIPLKLLRLSRSARRKSIGAIKLA